LNKAAHFLDWFLLEILNVILFLMVSRENGNYLKEGQQEDQGGNDHEQYETSDSKGSKWEQTDDKGDNSADSEANLGGYEMMGMILRHGRLQEEDKERRGNAKRKQDLVVLFLWQEGVGMGAIRRIRKFGKGTSSKNFLDLGSETFVDFAAFKIGRVVEKDFSLDVVDD